MVTDLTQLGYVNNYDKNRYLEKISKAAVYAYPRGDSMKTIGHLKISRTWTAEMEMDKLSRDYLMRDN